MSKQIAISRYHLIIRKLRRFPATFEQISDYLALESEIQGYDFRISKRTFQRDIKDIRLIYKIDIRYSAEKGGYYIDEDDSFDLTGRILEAFDVFNALNVSDRLSRYIHFEKRKSRGTENMYGILHAIKNRFLIIFTHRKYWEEGTTKRTVEPYALKEFSNRWYVVGKDRKDGRIKSFGLDRITDLEITRTHFDFPGDFDVNEYYKYCFGIVGPPDGQKPENIILSFTPQEGRYIKSLPLHQTQEIVKDDKNGLVIKLKVYITYDFIMELLSHGNQVKVLQPESLISILKNTYSNSLRLYNN